MENLFSTRLEVNRESAFYQVLFDNEKYIFESQNKNNQYANFSLKREHDEWIETNAIPSEIKTQAVDALENYLLKQH
jgi:hypothetical protein